MKIASPEYRVEITYNEEFRQYCVKYVRISDGHVRSLSHHDEHSDSKLVRAIRLLMRML